MKSQKLGAYRQLRNTDRYQENWNHIGDNVSFDLKGRQTTRLDSTHREHSEEKGEEIPKGKG